MQNKQESPLANILFNIVIPTMILNRGSQYFPENGALFSLLLALLFPVAYSIRDVIKRGFPNPIAALGLLNVSITGGFALLELEGSWFALKEAAFPMAIGLLVFVSAFSKTPLIEYFLLNPQIFNKPLIESKLDTLEKKTRFRLFLRNATIYLSLSFLMSAILNFALAVTIFTPIDSSLGKEQRSQILNEQIARMTWQGYLVIALPSMIVLGLILYYIARNIKLTTGLTLEQILLGKKPDIEINESEHNETKA